MFRRVKNKYLMLALQSTGMTRSGGQRAKSYTTQLGLTLALARGWSHCRQLGYASMSFRKKTALGVQNWHMQVSINRSKPGNAARRHIMKSGLRRAIESTRTRDGALFVDFYLRLSQRCQSRSRSLVAPELPPPTQRPLDKRPLLTYLVMFLSKKA
jgi:hypothetical protein